MTDDTPLYRLTAEDIHEIVRDVLDTLHFIQREARDQGWQLHGIYDTGTLALSIGFDRLAEKTQRDGVDLPRHARITGHTERLTRLTFTTLLSYEVDLELEVVKVLVRRDLLSAAWETARLYHQPDEAQADV